MAVFSNYANIKADEKSYRDSGIPYFNFLSKTPDGTVNSLTQGMTFTKATANYQREARFQMESLFSLSQLASVYNASVVTNTFY